MADDHGEKTIPTTPERRRRMRAAGHVAHSADLAHAGVLLCGLLALVVTGSALVEFLAGLIASQLSGRPWLAELDAPSAETLTGAWTPLVSSLGKVLMPLLCVVVVAGVGLNLAQTGLLFLPSRVLPDASRINPGAGLARIVSSTGAARLAVGLLKFSAVGAVALWTVHQRRIEIVGAAGLDLAGTATLAWQLCLATATKIGLSLGVLAVVDYGYRRWRYERDLMMTPQEMREEMRNEQGDPAIAARRRAIQSRSLPEPLDVAVPKAQLVVTGGEYAVALQYDPATMTTPCVVARGAGSVAGRLRELATGAGVHMAEEPQLAESLYRGTPLRGTLPASLWSEVARVLAESQAVASTSAENCTAARR